MDIRPGDGHVSTDYDIRILTRVSAALADNDDLSLSAMLDNVLGCIPGVNRLTDRGPLPRFGAGLSYDDTRFRDISGTVVRRRAVMVGVSCQNVHYPVRDADCDLPYGTPYETRLDRMLARLSAFSEGPPGEVAGCVCQEGDELSGHGGGQPVLRCRDGMLRLALVATDHDTVNELYGHPVESEPRAPLPAIIPPAAIRPLDGMNLEAVIDVAMLKRMFAPLDLAANRPPPALPWR